MSSSVRAQVAAFLAPLIPTGWAVKPNTVKQITTLNKPTLFIEHTGIEPSPEAPIGTVHNQVVVTFLSRHTDYAKAEDELDADVLEFINQLDGSEQLAWSKADKVSVPADEPRYLGWAITLTVITETKE